MKLIVSNSAITLDQNRGLSASNEEMSSFLLKAKSKVGNHLKASLQNAGIDEANAWEALGISTIELRSWQIGAVSPRCSHYFGVMTKLGAEVYFSAGLLLNELIVEGQAIRMELRNKRWDGGYRVNSDALGVCQRWVA